MPLRTVLAALIAALVTLSAAPETPRAEVLVLGVYHMANPGRDIFNTKADDVLTPKRQAEIAQLIEALKKFKPTKVAIEADVYSERAPKQYADFLAGNYTLTRNENDQIGYRLAKELGHAIADLVVLVARQRVVAGKEVGVLLGGALAVDVGLDGHFGRLEFLQRLDELRDLRLALRREDIVRLRVEDVAPRIGH